MAISTIKVTTNKWHVKVTDASNNILYLNADVKSINVVSKELYKSAFDYAANADKVIQILDTTGGAMYEIPFAAITHLTSVATPVTPVTWAAVLADFNTTVIQLQP